jgi:hypothetical protein
MSEDNSNKSAANSSPSQKPGASQRNDSRDYMFSEPGGTNECVIMSQLPTPQPPPKKPQ